MAKTTPTPSSASQFFSGGLIILYLCIGFVPNWGAVDKIAPQWLALGILHLCSVLVFWAYRKEFLTQLRLTLSSTMALLYIGFFLWAAVSYFYALNPTEVLVNLPRHLNTLLMYLFMAVFIGGIAKRASFFSWVITLILGVEVYAVLTEAAAMIESTGTIASGTLKGVTANRNITAFSIAIKVPFVVYLVLQAQARWLQLAQGLLVTLSLVCLTIIQSRAAFVASGATLVLFMGLCLYFYKTTKTKKWLWAPSFYVLPLLVSLLLNSVYFSDKGADALDRASTISVSTNDGSVNQRLRYYEDVLTHMTAHPFLGTGLGNWKIKSIDYDKNDIRGYVVPYHAHSDFIQLGAELGIIGFLLYLGVFVFALIFVVRVFRSQKATTDQKLFIGLLLTALAVYTVDANLNFPIARPQVLAPWALVMALITYYHQSIFKTNTATISPKGAKELAYSSFPFLALLLLVPAIYITNTTYKSLKAQMLILQDFNSNKYNLPLNQIETFITPLPNITVTTIPMDAIKARYYFHYKKYDKALALAESAKEANPYLRYPEILQSQIYEAQGDREAAWEMAKLAFEQLPRNPLHASKFINLSMQLGKREAIKAAFPLLTLHNEQNNWKNYLVAVAQLFPPGQEPFVAQAAKAVALFPGNRDILNLQSQITFGIKIINQAAQYAKEGLNYFNQQQYAKAALAFEEAIRSNPLEYSNFENAATSYYLLNQIEKGLEKIDVVITSLNPNNGKCEYIKALLLIRMQDAEGACPLFKTAVSKGYTSAQEMLKSYCNQ